MQVWADLSIYPTFTDVAAVTAAELFKKNMHEIIMV